MGLVVTAYSAHTQSGRVCTDGSSSSNKEEIASLDGSLVRGFNHVSAMKTLTVPGILRNELDQYVVYAQGLSNGIDTDVAMKTLDTYLGTVGVTNGIC